jgi:hypothetical protein
MTRHVLTTVVGLALIAVSPPTEVQAQAGSAATDSLISVEFEFIPFVATPRPASPRILVFVEPASRLTCPIPVALGNTAIDTLMLAEAPSGVTARPMPGADAGQASRCRNPLFSIPLDQKAP